MPARVLFIKSAERDFIMTKNSRGRITVLKTAIRIACILLALIIVAGAAAFALVFAVARGPYRDAAAMLCGTLADIDRGLCGVFFTSDEIHSATYYFPPEPAVTTAFYPGCGELAQDGAQKYSVSGKGWKGVVIVTEAAPGKTALNERNIGQSSSDYSIGLLGGRDAVYIGKLLSYAGNGGDEKYCMAAMTADGRLVCGGMTVTQITCSGYEWAVFADRVLVNGGMPCTDLGGGYGTRAAIGQTIDGRIILFHAQASGIWPHGASYDDVAAVMFGYGAVTAAAVAPEGGLREGGKLLSGAGRTPAYTVTVTAGEAGDRNG